jgi:hypothetical protein
MSEPVLVVAGLGRCGSSLTMQMLQAGGMPCVGTFPDLEVEETNHRDLDIHWLASFPGHAIKVLDPHISRLPREAKARVIWLDRDFREQAQSQAKMATAFLRQPWPRASVLRDWAGGLREERRLAMNALRGRDILCLSYERLIRRPRETAWEIVAFCSPMWLLKADAMAAAVRKDDPRCSPDLAMECALVAEAEAALPLEIPSHG